MERIFRYVTVIFLYSIVIGVILIFSYWWYLQEFSPSKGIGHWVGYAGGGMMVFTQVYTIRRRMNFLQGIGARKAWLDLHIYLGLIGPTLIAYHTTYKLGGIVAVSFWSMVVVMVSGIMGRYIYVQIPVGIADNEDELNRLKVESDLLTKKIDKYLSKGVSIHTIVEELSGMKKVAAHRGIRSLVYLFAGDVLRPFRFFGLRIKLLFKFRLPFKPRREVYRLVREQTMIIRRIILLQVAQQLLDYWIIFHRIFSWIMFNIMILHIIVALLFKAA
ncbi:MAG: hypothetical protein HZA06_04365 [Nitrospirae bacterium]|nr:hypothetical protein [Nitrospirota bacterium]